MEMMSFTFRACVVDTQVALGVCRLVTDPVFAEAKPPLFSVGLLGLAAFHTGLPFLQQTFIFLCKLAERVSLTAPLIRLSKTKTVCRGTRAVRLRVLQLYAFLDAGRNL